MPKQHWVITLQWAEDDGLQVQTLEGTIDPNPGATRQEIYLGAYRYAAGRLGATNAAVITWTLNPDEL